MGIKEKISNLYRSTKHIIQGSLENKPLLPGQTLVQDCHKFIAWVFGVMFSFIQFGLIAEDSLQCFNQGDASAMPKRYVDLCKKVGYSIVSATGSEQPLSAIALYFPYSLLSVSIFYIILMGFSAFWGLDHRIKRMIDNCLFYDVDSPEEKNSKQRNLCEFLQESIGSCQHVFYRSLIVHIFLLASDMSIVAFIYYLSHGKVLELVYELWERDQYGIEDKLSLMFPPFTTCRLTPEFSVVGKTTVIFRCFNPIMEVSKILCPITIFIELILIVLVVFQMVYWLLCLSMPCIRCRLISTGGVVLKYDSTVADKASFGDVMVLNSFRQHLEGYLYIQAMKTIAKRLK